MKQYRFIRGLGTVVGGVGGEVENIFERVAAEYEPREPPSEREENPAIGDRIETELLQRIQGRLDQWEKDGVEFQTCVLSAENKNSGKSVTSVDLAIVFEADLPEYKVSKAVLVQSNTWRSRSSKGQFDTTHLEAKIDYMLGLSSDSFLFVYPVDGSVKVVPAVSVKALFNAGEPIPSNYPQGLYTKSIGRFFEELAECYIGDHEIMPWTEEPLGWNKPTLQAFIDERQIDTLLYIAAQNDEPEATLKDFT